MRKNKLILLVFFIIILSHCFAQNNIDSIQILKKVSYNLTDTTNLILTLNASDFNKGINITPLDLIQGKIPGIIILSNSGAPKNTFTIKDKRVYSFSSQNNLLFYIDNVPVDPNLMCINPNDVEKIIYIDDPAIARKYSNQVSNGILLITTKKGSDKFSVNYSNNFSLSTLIDKIDVFSADEFRALINERYADNPDVLNLPLDYSTDWQDEIYKNAFGQDHFLNISGHLKSMPFKFSAGKTNLDGILRSSNLNRTTTQIFIEPSLFKNHLKLTLDFKGTFNKDRIANTDAIKTAVHYDPTRPVYFLEDYSQYYDNSLAPFNPVALLDYTRYTSDIDNWNNNIRLDYTFHFFPDLRFIINYGKTDYKENSTTFRDAFIESARYPSEEDSKTSYTNTFTDVMFTYSKNIEPLKTFVDCQFGTSRQKFKASEDYSALYPDSEFKTIKSSSERSVTSYFTQLHLTFLKKYSLNAMFSHDGSSRFSDEDRWSDAKAISFSWNLKNEPFLINNNTISSLNLRLIYNKIPGKDYTPVHTFTTSYVNSNSETHNKSASAESLSELDPNIGPEEITTYSIGAGFGFYNRINGSFEYYKGKTSDLPAEVTVFNNTLFMKVGSMENKGINAYLNSLIFDKNHFKWNLGVSFNYSENKILNDNPDLIGVNVGYTQSGNSIQILSPNYSAYSFYVYEQIYDETGKPIEGAYVDRNGDGSEDKYHYKNPNADILMGISSLLRYKNWEFSFSGRAIFGNYVYNNIDTWSSYDQIYTNDYLRNISTSVNKTNFESAHLYSDYYVENASFFKMDYISLKYNIKQILRQKIDLSIFTTVQNVFVITNYSGIDPEMPTGIDNYSYPRSRTFSLGLNLRF